MSGFFDELFTATESARETFLQIPQLQRGARGDISRAIYIAFLTQAYHHVKHTVPLLMACGSRLDESLEWLRTAVGEYIQEEVGHQEWILDDIHASGGDAEAVRNGVPDPATELMVAYAYDSVQRNNPVGLFGMVLVLEGTSVQLATSAADALQQALGLPDQAFRYLRSHGSLDQKHMQSYRALMDRLTRPVDRQAVIHCARMFYRLYGDIYRGLPLTD